MRYVMSMMMAVICSLVFVSSVYAAPSAGIIRGVKSAEGYTQLTDGLDTAFTVNSGTSFTYNLGNTYRIDGYYAYTTGARIYFYDVNDTQLRLLTVSRTIGISGFNTNAYISLSPIDNVAKIKIVANSGASGMYEFDFSGVIVDNTPPAQPTGFIATNGVLSVNLAWNRNTEIDLAGYNVYQNGVLVNTSLITSNSYVVPNLTADQGYAFQVSAVDTAGNESTKTAAVSATAMPTLQVPVLSSGDVTPNSLRLNWNPHTAGNSYDVYKDGIRVVTGRTTNSSDFSLLTPDTEYTFQVKGRDKYYRTFETNIITVKTGVPTVSKPSINISDLSHQGFKASWSEVQYATSYTLYLDDVEVYTGTDKSYSVSGLSEKTTYTVKLVAANDLSSADVSRTVTTTAAPVPAVTSAKTSPVPGDPNKRQLTYTATPDVTAVKVYVDGQLIGEYPVSQSEIELDFKDINSSFAGIQLEPIPPGESYSFSSLAQSTGDEDADQLLSLMLSIFTYLKGAFKYIAIMSIVFLTTMCVLFFWLRDKYKRVTKLDIKDKPFADTSNMRDDKARKLKKGFVVDDMPNDNAIPRKPWSKMSDKERLAYRFARHEQKTGYKIVDSKFEERGGLFNSRVVENLTYERNGVKYVKKQVKGKRGRQTVYVPKTMDDKVKHVSNQFNAVKSAFTGSNKSKFK
ncbi:fibronectin type III domain-containing protein [Paenibacillus sp. y28]|uniref:fibronectin type III domain-containing protein n=1 Tax=Paenibacillus sp. y28 TaxID=3129110 RepID=UPI003019ADDD